MAKADYKSNSVELADAAELVGQAEMFVTAMRTAFPSAASDNG